MRSFFDFFASLRLTVFLLSASLLLVFFGTLDQVHYGIYFTQNRYFEHFFVVWQYPEQFMGSQWLSWFHLPLPGGYLLGLLLLINLFAAHLKYYQAKWRKVGIIFIHGGLALLLIGQLWTQLAQVDSFMWLGEGEESNFVEAFQYDELVIIDKSDPETDRVYSWPVEAFRDRETDLSHPDLPFDLRILGYAENTAIFPRPPAAQTNTQFPVQIADRGLGAERDLVAMPMAATYADGERNIRSAYVQILSPDRGPLGTWLVANIFRQTLPLREFFAPQQFEAAGKTWEIALRFKRTYLPAYVHLEDFQHDRYPGTDIPYNFSSDVTIRDKATGSTRDALIYMNHPLRFGGLTFYQASFADNDTKSMFQVVRNPARWLPYAACAIMSLGLLMQFCLSFAQHRHRRKAKVASAATKPAQTDTTPKPSLPIGGKIAMGVILGLAALLFLRDVQPNNYASDFDISTFAQLPVQEGGRVKPLDTVARANLMLLAGRQTWRDNEGNKHPAAEWLMDLMLFPARAADHRIFRIDHPDVTAILGVRNETQKYFSLREIAPHFDTLRAQFAQVNEEPRLRTPYERALMKLQQNIGVYDSLAYNLVPAPLFGTAANEYETLQRVLHDHAAGASDGSDAETVRNALGLFTNAYGRLAASLGIQAIPPAQIEEEWENLGVSLQGTLLSGELDPVVKLWAEASLAYKQGNALAFNTTLNQLEDLYQARGDDSATKVPFEYFFNTFAPFYYAMELYVLLLLVAAASWLFWGNALARAAFWLMAIAFVVHTFGMGARIYLQERPPVTNLYSSAVFVGWGAVLLCLFLEKGFRNAIPSAAAALIGFSTLIIAHHLSYTGDTLEMMRAVLDSNFWLATHVPTVTIGYSATFLAGALGLVYILRDRFFGGIDPKTAQAISGMVYGIICFALLFSFIGTVLGGVWADQSWGRFWGWDPKENGALMIVLWNAVILHARWGGLSGPMGIMQMTLIGNIITAWSWFGTNMLGVGLHSYGFMDAAFWWLLIFVISQLLLIALGWLPRLSLRQTTAPKLAAESQSS